MKCNIDYLGENTEHMIETANLTPEAFEEVSNLYPFIHYDDYSHKIFYLLL